MKRAAGFVKFQQAFVVVGGFLLAQGQRGVPRLLGGGHGVVESAGLRVSRREGADHDGLRIMRQVAGAFRQLHGERAISFGRIRTGGERPGEVVQEGGIVGAGEVGFETEGFQVLADRFVRLALVQEGEAEVVVGLGGIRLEAEGFLKLADGPGGLAAFKEDVAEIDMGERVIGVEAE